MVLTHTAPGDSPEAATLPSELAGYPYPEDFTDLLTRRLPAGRASLGVLAGVDALRFPAFLLAHGFNLFAVDAHPEKRDACDRLQRFWPNFRAFAGSPAATGLEDASVDFIVSDRALHWPDPAALRGEFRRILRPGGTVALITDNRVYTGGEQAEAFLDLLRTHCPEFREREPSSVGPAVTTLFAGGEVFEDAFTGHQDLSLDEFLQGTRALPIYPGKGGRTDRAIEVALHKFFSQWSRRGHLRVPTVCRIALGSLPLA